jgi:hypothetical protein
MQRIFRNARSYGRGGLTIDYENMSPYADLSAAREHGDLVVRTFGLAVDPLCYKPELLTVCVFSARTCDTIFANIVSDNEEGTLLVGLNRQWIPFTKEYIALDAEKSETSWAAVACLKLAWRHRRQLGLV